jgi:uncharacterized protein (TIGR02145 family)
MLCTAGALQAQSGEGVTINGVTWAKTNVGVRGAFMDYPWHQGSYHTFEEAKVACPQGWRLPSREEFATLNQAHSEWTIMFDAYGYRFGSGGSSVFLPASGYLHRDSEVKYKDLDGHYWTSTPEDGQSAWSQYFSKAGQPKTYINHQEYHFSVRCVKVSYPELPSLEDIENGATSASASAGAAEEDDVAGATDTLGNAAPVILDVVAPVTLGTTTPVAPAAPIEVSFPIHQ